MMVERDVQRIDSNAETVPALWAATHHGAFFARHLRPGMRVLDVGYGVRSLVVQFVEGSASPESDLGGAEKRLLEVADAAELPFSESSFDAVFAHGILCHRREPAAVLMEMRRVLRSGGFVGVCEHVWEESVATPGLERWCALQKKMLERSKRAPLGASRCRRLLREAGLERIETSVSAWRAGTPEQVRSYAAFLNAQLRAIRAIGADEDGVTLPAIDAVAEEIELWARREQATCADTYCEAVGFA